MMPKEAMHLPHPLQHQHGYHYPYGAPFIPMFEPSNQVPEYQMPKYEPFPAMWMSQQMAPQVDMSNLKREAPTYGRPIMEIPSMPSFQAVQQHQQPLPKLRSPQNEIMFTCQWDQCSQQFSTRTGLATHCSTHLEHFLKDACARKKQKIAVRCLWRDCADAAVEFDNFRQLAKHLSCDSHIGQMPFLPKIVGVTVNPEVLPEDPEEETKLSHKKAKKEKQYMCSHPFCGKVFNDSSNRKKHEKTHDANRERFFCPEEGCTKSYSTRTDLNIHLKVHKGEYPHKCTHPQCTKAFVRLSELYAHERTHDNILPHICVDCGRRFREKARLKKHQASHGHTAASTSSSSP